MLNNRKKKQVKKMFFLTRKSEKKITFQNPLQGDKNPTVFHVFSVDTKRQ